MRPTPLFRLVAAPLALIVILSVLPVMAEGNGMININGNDKAWRTEFDEICALVDGALDLSREELESLLFRCRVLEPRLQELPETPRKVFTRKLRMCRDLYQFMLEQKSAAGASAGGEAAGRREGR